AFSGSKGIAYSNDRERPDLLVRKVRDDLTVAGDRKSEAPIQRNGGQADLLVRARRGNDHDALNGPVARSGGRTADHRRKDVGLGLSKKTLTGGQRAAAMTPCEFVEAGFADQRRSPAEARKGVL